MDDNDLIEELKKQLVDPIISDDDAFFNAIVKSLIEAIEERRK